MRKLAALLLFLGAAAQAETIAIVGGTVHTVGPDGTIENATVVIDNGRITAVGSNVSAPSGAIVVDAVGKIVTPGIFSPEGNLGLVEVGFSAGPLDYVQTGDQFTASFDIADAFNPASTLIGVNRIEGVTRALIVPSTGFSEDMSSHVISGMAAVVNLSGGDDSIDRRAAALVVHLGERSVGLAGASRVSSLLVLRQALDEAIDYREHGDAYERGQHRDYAFSTSDLAALQPVLTGNVPMLVSVHRRSDIAGLIALVEEYGVRAIISGGAEAWMLADELAAARIPVLVHPGANLPSNFDRLNANAEAPAILSNAGVTIAFADEETHNARNLTQSAGNATVVGMSWDDALRAITLSPAEIYGVAESLGSIEVGKQGDIVIWPGDPLELGVYPEIVLINGEPVEMESRQTLLRDRYLDPASTTPPAYRR